ncbi:hypothetical protein AALO_G00043590 [Alosa alosa]|uniref:Uncharacterized protein n=1 Tax=Alosa alosa TaxID=278164 RepID=A0AAV6HC77_9TELE|nr:hypothetical protein AALO_G00043590 [Alosa alosa]
MNISSPQETLLVVALSDNEAVPMIVQSNVPVEPQGKPAIPFTNPHSSFVRRGVRIYPSQNRNLGHFVEFIEIRFFQRYRGVYENHWRERV